MIVKSASKKAKDLFSYHLYRICMHDKLTISLAPVGDIRRQSPITVIFIYPEYFHPDLTPVTRPSIISRSIQHAGPAHQRPGLARQLSAPFNLRPAAWHRLRVRLVPRAQVVYPSPTSMLDSRASGLMHEKQTGGEQHG